MKGSQRMIDDFDTGTPSFAELADVLITGRQQAFRLSDSHYLVQWHPGSPLWCVINMAALDEHAGKCATFRYRQSCEHLGYIYQLCSGEAQGRSRLLN